MAARKTKDVNQVWRTKIQTSMLINRLQSYIKGEVKLEPAQVTAALGLLKKTAPDLSTTTLDATEGMKAAIKGIGIKFV